MLAVVVAINVLAALIDAFAPSPSGPASSSFATKPEGLAAWAELARRNHIAVRGLRDSPAGASLQGTVVVMDGQLSGAEARALRRFAERGGRVIAGGAPGAWTATLLGDREPPRWASSGPETATPTGAAPETANVARVKSAGDGRWKERGVLGSLLLVRPAGRGRIVLLADSSPLQNRLLGEADNAAFALALSGKGPLTFVESVHGYGPARGLAALPARFGWALIGLLLAALVLWSPAAAASARPSASAASSRPRAAPTSTRWRRRWRAARSARRRSRPVRDGGPPAARPPRRDPRGCARRRVARGRPLGRPRRRRGARAERAGEGRRGRRGDGPRARRAGRTRDEED